jgi:hypothetical protein
MAKASNEDIDESWVDWAQEMMEAGFESMNLYILAGITKPYNQFELQELTDNVLKDLHSDYSDRDRTIRNYAYYIIKSAIGNADNYMSALRELNEIYMRFDMENEYLDFMLLYYTKVDLAESPDQWYWDGATTENIDEIIRGKFQSFIDNFERAGQA